MIFISREKFEELVKRGIKAIPERFLEKLDNVDIVIEDEPIEAQIKKLKLGKNSKLFGLYEGVPQTKRGFYSGVLPDKITIFKKTFEEICSSEDEIKKRVGQTVWHEIAHHFGMDEERVRKMEKKKKV
jgi:predicted Zn-dependent protease with MMP-like domain